MAWQHTPKERRIMAQRYVRETGVWELVEYCDLHKGDIFQAIGVDGAPVNPVTNEPEDGIFALCEGEPIENATLGEGYAVPLLVGPLEDMIGAASN